MQFADVKNDIAFRKFFGDENRKETLISFLNAILDFKGKQRIIDVNILNPYQFPKLSRGKITIVDIKASDQQGRSYIVEMQVGDLEGFPKRVLYYASKSYSDQIKRSDFYRKLYPVILVGILDFELTQNPHYLSRHRVLDVETGEQTIKDIEFTFVELPKFHKKPKELKTLAEKWIFFIKNAEELTFIPDTDDAGLLSAYEQANMHTWTQKELDAYDYTFMREEDGRARIDKAEAKGMEKGRAEIICSMSKSGLSTEQIAEITKMSVNEVKKILKNCND